MSKRSLNERTIPDLLTELWKEGYFVGWKDRLCILEHLSMRGHNLSEASLVTALTRARFLISRKKNQIREYIQKHPAVDKEFRAAENQLFDDLLVKKLGKNFQEDIRDLHINFGKSGTCTAFLLRKILEKLIFLAFAKNGIESKLEDPGAVGRLMGLEAMINIASQEKVGGVSFLTPSTAKEIKGIKFLGDASAHNPLVNVDMRTIVPQMPFIITAYKELAHKL